MHCVACETSFNLEPTTSPTPLHYKAAFRQAGGHFDSSPNFRVARQTPTRAFLTSPAGRSVIVVSPMPEHSKFLLADSQIPSVWVNVLPSLQIGRASCRERV